MNGSLPARLFQAISSPGQIRGDAAASFTPQYLLVKIGSHEFALPSGPIRHLITQPEVIALHDSPEWCLGMVAASGVVAPLLNTHRILGMAPPGKLAAGVLVELAAGPSSAWFAVAVDRLTLTVRIRNSEFRPVKRASSLPFRSCVASVWRGRSRPCYLLHLPELIPLHELESLTTLFLANLQMR